MSFAALAFVSKMRVGSAADKLIALAYADRHNEETGCAYPSVDALVEFSCLNRKTVIASVARLEACGFLTDTGERRGHTRQIKVYSLAIESVPKTEPFQNRNSTENGGKQSQKRDTEPVRTSSSTKATLSTKKRPSKPKLGFHRLPDDWEPSPLPSALAAKIALWPPGKHESETDAFRGWAANAKDEDGKGRKLNWDAAYHNWLNRTHTEWTSQNGRHQPNLRPGDNPLRGQRPDPALDLLRASQAAQRVAGSGGDYFEARAALPPF